MLICTGSDLLPGDDNFSIENHKLKDVIPLPGLLNSVSVVKGYFYLFTFFFILISDYIILFTEFTGFWGDD